MDKFSNKLVDETSPYLLQHAHNPVNWFPWGEEALELAKKENKPILVSIGYSACHWCHVMEKESFEDEATAQIMNENFVNVKIDREERPDLDHIYMDAVQAMTGSGGWPLNVFLTPDQKPFYGGTYFPPVRAFNRPSWKEILIGVSQAFKERRNEIDAQSQNLMAHIIQANSFGQSHPGDQTLFSEAKTEEIVENIMKTADTQWGGFGRAPKFPQTFTIQFLLRYASLTNLQLSESKAPSEGGVLGEAQALLSIDKMIDGGIYDQVGGGFARYSTDAQWLVPHFEKMLYDNALLISVISEAYQATKKERYREIIQETIQFIKREMMHARGGFYAALDADSEGVEGKFYVWDYDEVKQILGDDAEIFCSFFDITEKGNFEEKNIPWRKKTEEQFYEEHNIETGKLKKIIQQGKQKLLQQREKRVRPGLDDKILLSWNALMNTALSKAFAATGNDEYRQLAIGNMQFLLDNFEKNENDFFHSWKNNKARHPAFLDDYAYLVQSLILLQEITGEKKYLLKAKEITRFILENFSDEKDGKIFFYFTHRSQNDVIVRKKEIYDGAQPSGNAVMADNLYRLSLYFGIPEWKARALAMVSALGGVISRHPGSFGVWAGLFLEIVNGTEEIAIIGNRQRSMLEQVLEQYIPHKIIMCSEQESSQFPLLSDKKKGDPALIYLCRNYTCQKPVSSVDELLTLRRLDNKKLV